MSNKSLQIGGIISEPDNNDSCLDGIEELPLEAPAVAVIPDQPAEVAPAVADANSEVNF